MAVPIGTMKLSDVIAEIGSGTSLVGCFALANAGGFDPTYEGTKDRLSNFQNYVHDTEDPSVPTNLVITGEYAPL